MKLGNCKSRAFTIVEFLVVMAVIALLTAISMPGLKMVRGLARQAVCLTNMRSCHTGQTLHAADNNNALAPWMSWKNPHGSPGYNFKWPMYIAPYVDEGWAIRWTQGYRRLDWIVGGKIFFCPEIELPNNPDQGDFPWWWGNGESGQTSYSQNINQSHLFVRNPPNPAWPTDSSRTSQYRFSEVILGAVLFAEQNPYCGFRTDGWFNYGIHQDGLNVMCFDGHGEYRDNVDDDDLNVK